nr:hypothetical protein [Candidatus Pacearchaeota archaeon]
CEAGREYQQNTWNTVFGTEGEGTQLTVIQPLTAINGRVWETKYFIPKQNNMNQKGTVLCLQEAGGVKCLQKWHWSVCGNVTYSKAKFRVGCLHGDRFGILQFVAKFATGRNRKEG